VDNPDAVGINRLASYDRDNLYILWYKVMSVDNHVRPSVGRSVSAPPCRLDVHSIATSTNRPYTHNT